MQLEHVHHTNRDLVLEWLAGSTVEKHQLTRGGHVGGFQKALDLDFVRPVENRRGHMNTLLKTMNHAPKSDLVGFVEDLIGFLAGIDALELLPERSRVPFL